MSSNSKESAIVLVDGCRTPFQKPGTGYRNFRAHDLARFVIRGILDRTGVDPGDVDGVIMGSVIQDAETANVAREAALGAGLAAAVPAHTVSMSCLSSHQAITGAAEQILSGQADVMIAGGVDSVSAHESRRPLKKQTTIPYLTEFSTGETMGAHADRLASLFGITREIQDAYTVRSHQSAVRAQKEGLTGEEIVPVTGPPDFVPVSHDNEIRSDCTPETLSVHKPAFDSKFGTVTAAGSANHADGAAAVLLMRESTAKKLGFSPKARLTSWVYTAHDPKNEMLLGQASAIPALLDKAKVASEQIDVFELHEAFAAQVLAVLEALSVNYFSTGGSGTRNPAASIPLKKLNAQGGSLALGHVFGATGARLVISATQRLMQQQGRYAMASSCAGGGLGHAILLESVKPVNEKSTGSKAESGKKSTAAGATTATGTPTTTGATGTAGTAQKAASTKKAASSRKAAPSKKAASTKQTASAKKTASEKKTATAEKAASTKKAAPSQKTGESKPASVRKSENKSKTQ